MTQREKMPEESENEEKMLMWGKKCPNENKGVEVTKKCRDVEKNSKKGQKFQNEEK